MPAKVVLSYTKNDKSIADAVCNELEANGIRCWIAPRDCLAGSDFAISIMKAIKDCAILIVILSKDAQKSPYVKNEIANGFKYGKIIIPFKVDTCELSDDLQYYLNRFHWIDATTQTMGTHIDTLVTIILAILDDDLVWLDKKTRYNLKRKKIFKTLQIVVLSSIVLGFVVISFKYYTNIYSKKILIDISLYEHKEAEFPDSSYSIRENQYYSKKTDTPMINNLDQADFGYKFKSNNNCIEITPKINYYDQILKNTIQDGTNLYSNIVNPILSFKILNNTYQTIYLNGVEIEVISSKLNTEPLPLVLTKTRDYLKIRNEGWGKIINPSIHFDIVDSSVFDTIKTISKPLKYSILLDNFYDSATIAINNFVEGTVGAYSSEETPETASEDGVYLSLPDSNLLKEEDFQANEDITSFLQFEHEKNVHVYGIFEYQNDKSKFRSIKFKSIVIVNRIDQIMAKSYINFSSIYGIKLRAGHGSYKKKLQISQAIKAGEADQFLLELRSDKSASYNLHFNFTSLNGETIISPQDIFVEFFVPRTNN